MKLSEVEEKLKTEGFSEDLFSLFLAGLKRVRGNYNKCQHCYTTAYALKGKDHEAAIRMVHYGLENFAGSWTDFYRSYENLARIYLRRDRFTEARECYLAELEKMTEFKAEQYADVLAVDLVFAEMHCEDFACTDNLRKYYGLAGSDLAKTAFTRRERFYYALAALVIALHDLGTEGAKPAWRDVMRILKGLDANANDEILRRHRYLNDAYATGQALRYLEKTALLLHED